MHPESMVLMRQFVRNLLKHNTRNDLTVLDVGSMDVNGTYRELFPESFNYVGIDLAPGEGVDLVVDPYDWGIDGTVDVAISGQCLEHVERPWQWFLQLFKACKPGGIVCVIAPSKGAQHRYPVDCFRYFPDGMRALGEFAGFEEIDIAHNPESKWGDVRYIASKPCSIGCNPHTPGVESRLRTHSKKNGFCQP